MPMNFLKDWSDIRLLLEIAERGGLTAAADALQLDRDTVGGRLDALERQLGRPLFVRRAGRAGTIPTGAGEYLLGHAQVVRSAILRFEKEMAAVRTLEQRVTISGPPGVMHYTLVPVMMGSTLMPQPLDGRIIAHPLPPIDFVDENDASVTPDIQLHLTSVGDVPDLAGNPIISRVGKMRFSPFAPRRTTDTGRIETFQDLGRRSLFQRADYVSVKSMGAWNDLCAGVDHRDEFTSSIEMYRAFKAGHSISIFPNYSGLYDPEAVRIEPDGMPEIALSVWMASGSANLREPGVRRVYDTIRTMFTESQWYN